MNWTLCYHELFWIKVDIFLWFETRLLSSFLRGKSLFFSEDSPTSTIYWLSAVVHKINLNNIIQQNSNEFTIEKVEKQQLNDIIWCIKINLIFYWYFEYLCYALCVIFLMKLKMVSFISIFFVIHALVRHLWFFLFYLYGFRIHLSFSLLLFRLAHLFVIIFIIIFGSEFVSRCQYWSLSKSFCLFCHRFMSVCVIVWNSSVNYRQFFYLSLILHQLCLKIAAFSFRN